MTKRTNNSRIGGIALPLSLITHYTTNMKFEYIDLITLLIVAVMVLGVDFTHMGLMDYIILAVSGVFVVLFAFKYFIFREG